MNPLPNTATEGLLSSTERWRESLTNEQRSDALLPLQAVLSGLVAFRDLENQALSAPVTGFHLQLRAVHAGYGWALQLLARLRVNEAQQVAGPALDEPRSSLRALERTLSDALRVNEQLLELPLVDLGTFQASCDLFLRELRRNSFFHPPEPLEFSNARELLRPEGLITGLEHWDGAAEKTATTISFLTLLRDHRFLGIADRRLHEQDGVYCAHILAAAIRRELRTLSRFLLVRRVETFADELETRLLSVEALATWIHAESRSALDYPLPELDLDGGHALASERMHEGIRELQATVKDAAKQLHALGRSARSERPNRESERVQKNLHQDIWAFRLILQAFIAKASAASLIGEGAGHRDRLDFAVEFLRHFRLFGLRLSRGTQYARRGPLTHAVSALRESETIDEAELQLAKAECILFLEHLDEALREIPESPLGPFDKNRAAAELRDYLSAVKEGGF